MAKTPWTVPDGFDDTVKKALSNLFKALRNSRKHITPEALNALRTGNLAVFANLIDWDGITAEFDEFKTILAEQAEKSALDLYRKGGVGSTLTFDLINERAVEWASKRAGELVVEIEDEMRRTIRDTITRSTRGELTVQQAEKLLRANLPLTPRDANAVLNYADRQYSRLLASGLSDLKARMKADMLAEKYADKLTRARALTIARTETARAAMEGTFEGWQAGVTSGLIQSDSQKEWIAEADACEICGPMDGVLVPWDAPFGSGVMTPPQHPNCRCSMAMLPPDYVSADSTPFTGQVYDSGKVRVEFQYGNVEKGLGKDYFEKADSYKPTEGMKIAARRALRWKEEGKAKGAGTPVGWGRATDIVAGRSMSLDIVKRMFSFFSRHEVDKKGKNFDNTSDPSNGRIMWDAWGGDAGFRWSRAIVERAKRVEKHLAGKHDQASHGRGGSSLSSFKESTVKDLPKAKNLTAREENALSSWYGADYASEVNKIVRGEKEANLDYEITYQAAALVNLTQKYQTSEPLIVRRYASASDFSEDGKTVNFQNLPSEVTYRGITPTSAYDTASWFDDRPLELRMHLPAGTKGVARTGSTPFSTDFEHEFLLAPNSTFKVVNVGEFNGRNRVVDLLLTSQEPYSNDALLSTLEKHLAGKHDQSTHGRLSATGKIPTHVERDVKLKATTRVIDGLDVGKLDDARVQRFGMAGGPQQGALASYTSDDDYKAINQGLRKDALSLQARQIVTQVDKAIDSNKTVEDLDVFRVAEKGRLPKGLKVGDTFSDKAYLSTSKHNPNSSDARARDAYGAIALWTKDPVIMTIRVPKGAKALDLGAYSKYSQEAEVLFPRETNLRVLSMDGNQLEVEVVS